MDNPITTVIPPAPLILPAAVLGGLVAIAACVVSNCNKTAFLSLLNYVFRVRAFVRSHFLELGLTTPVVTVAATTVPPRSRKCTTERSEEDDEDAVGLDEEDGCVLVRANAYASDSSERPCYTFEAVRRYAQLGYRVVMEYRLAAGTDDAGSPPSRDYTVTYNPRRGALLERQAVRCPPHVQSWCATNTAHANRGVIAATLLTHDAVGAATTYDVTEALRGALGPMGDFHSRAGSTLTAYTLMPDIAEDVVSASLLYFDEAGTEHKLKLPHAPGDTDPDGPSIMSTDEAANADDRLTSLPSEPSTLLAPEARVQPDVPSTRLNSEVIQAVWAAKNAKEEGSMTLARRSRTKGKVCDLQ